MRISDWSSDVCSSDLEVGMSSKFKDLRHEAGVPALLADARRIVVKIGSSLLIGESDGAARRNWLETVADDVAALANRDKQVAIVHSGAVAPGLGYLGRTRTARLARNTAARPRG